MKQKLLFLTYLMACTSFAQSDTEIFLFDIQTSNTTLNITNGVNISSNNGYDNQPSFIDDSTILFASERQGQTDIITYDIATKTKSYISTTEGSEYTPLKIPKQKNISAVRLDPDGKQRLYAYDTNNNIASELIKDLVVAYYTWYDSNTIVSAVIEKEQLNLYVTNLKTGKHQLCASKVGRSIHKIPNSSLVSFIYKESDTQWQIRSLDPETGITRLLAYTIPGVEDLCWLNSKTLLSAKAYTLYKLRLKRDNAWKKIVELSPYGLNNITRLTTNAKGTLLLLVGDLTDKGSAKNDVHLSAKNYKTPEKIIGLSETEAAALVQKHVLPFNTRQLTTFAAAFNENVIVNKFPEDHMYSGRQSLQENYRRFFKNNKKANIKVINRMVLNNWVVDEELVTINTMTIRQATVYEVNTKGIKSMTFIRNKKANTNPELIVNKHLEFYNQKDIEAFVKTYANDAKLFMFPDNLITSDITAIEARYKTLFKIPQLNAEIMNRIVIGNKVIDKQKITINETTHDAIVIYEINEGLISRMTFIQ